MKKNILAVIFSFALLLFFTDKVNATSINFSLAEYSDNPTTCIYKSNSDDSITIRYDESGLGSVYRFYVLYLEGNIKLHEDVLDVKVDKGENCPKEIILNVDTTTNFNEVTFNYKKVSCGNIEKIPSKIPELTSFIVTVIQIAIPIILVLLGSIDLFKGVTAGKEEEIKKGQQMFVKRLVVAVLIFLVTIIVKFLISIIADTGVADIVDCIDCFISNKCRAYF